MDRQHAEADASDDVVAAAVEIADALQIRQVDQRAQDVVRRVSVVVHRVVVVVALDDDDLAVPGEAHDEGAEHRDGMRVEGRAVVEDVSRDDRQHAPRCRYEIVDDILVLLAPSFPDGAGSHVDVGYMEDVSDDADH